MVTLNCVGTKELKADDFGRAYLDGNFEQYYFTFSEA